MYILFIPEALFEDILLIPNLTNSNKQKEDDGKRKKEEESGEGKLSWGLSLVFGVSKDPG